MPSVPVVPLTLYQNALGSALASAVGAKAVIDKTDGMNRLVACVRSLLKIESAPESFSILIVLLVEWAAPTDSCPALPAIVPVPYIFPLSRYP
jgi:hypothetical protein